MFRTKFAALLLAGTTLVVGPVQAGASLSLSFAASNPDEARAIRATLALYRIARGVESGAFVGQHGSVNAAAIRQVAGSGSIAVIHQEGSGHTAALDQQAAHQAHGIFQFGGGAVASVSQANPGQSGLTFQFGFD